MKIHRTLPRVIPYWAFHHTPESPSDSLTYYWGIGDWTLVATVNKQYIHHKGYIRLVRVNWNTRGVTGTNENISIYLRYNNAADYLIQTIGDAQLRKVFINQNLNISTADGDYFEYKVVCPAWVTNPTNVVFSGVVFLES